MITAQAHSKPHAKHIKYHALFTSMSAPEHTQKKGRTPGRPAPHDTDTRQRPLIMASTIFAPLIAMYSTTNVPDTAITAAVVDVQSTWLVKPV